MSILASLQHVCRRSRNGLTHKSAGLPFFALMPVLLLSFCALVLPASGQKANYIKTIAGGGTVSSTPALADIPGPTSAVVDGQGNLYAAAPFSQYIFKMSAGGAVSQFAGVGYIGFMVKSGPATSEPLWNPYGLAVDKAGNVYIADTLNNSVRKVDTSGNLTTIAGNGKPCENQGRCGDGGPATADKAKLNAPQGVALDSKGNVYIADTGDNRIRMVNSQGYIYAFAGNFNTGVCASPTSSCGDGGPAKKASLNGPVGIAFDRKNNLYISDTGDDRVRIVTKGVINAYAGDGTTCSPSTNPCGDGGPALEASMGPPRGVATDASGNVYIADFADERIRMVAPGTTPTISTLAGDGTRGCAGDGGSPTTAELAGPSGVFADSKGNLFISDTGNQVIREVSGGVITTVLGGSNCVVGNGGDNGAPKSAQLADPTGVAVDSSLNYYIADAANNRIRAVIGTGGNIQTLAGTGLSGYSGDGGAATSAELNGPTAVEVDSSGDLFIADTNNHVVREVSGGTISTFAGDGSPCLPPTGSCGEGGSATSANLSGPSAVAIDGGNVFIADGPTNRVWEVSGGIITNFAGTGTPCPKSTNACGDKGSASAAELNHPKGVAVDSNHNVYIADSGDNRVRCVIGTLGGCGDTQQKYPVGDILAYAYNGDLQFFTAEDGGLAINASRWLPTQVAVDSRGNLFIGGGNDELVQRVDLATGIIVTVAGNDTEWWFYGYSGDGAPATKAHIDNAGLAIDSNESLYIADAGNNVIRQVYHMVPVVALSTTSINFGSETVGQSSTPVDVTMTNTGSDDLNYTFTTTGDFQSSPTSGCASASVLAPSQSCTFAVTFTPTKKGTRNGKLEFTDNAPKSPQQVKLTGTGT